MIGFLFRGVHSSKFGISTQDQNRTILPPRREEKITIPGRSGYYGGVIGNVYDEWSESILCTFTGQVLYRLYGNKKESLEMGVLIGRENRTIIEAGEIESVPDNWYPDIFNRPYLWPGTCFSISLGTCQKHGKQKF